MTPRAVPLPNDPHQVALVYGPVVLVGQLGDAGITPGADIIVNERTYGDVLNTPVEVPALTSADVSGVRAVAGKPLTFTTGDLTTPANVALAPFFRTAHERYTMYWRIA